MEPITSFKRKETKFLSNFYPVTVTFEGEAYAAVEDAFQAAKTLDPTERKFIQLCQTPADARKCGRKVTLRSDWNAIKVDNWHLCKPFDDVEVQVLVDALQTVQGYPTAGLTEKVQKLGSHAMQKGNSSTDGKPSGNSMRYNMDAIMWAIREEKKITFGYQGTEEQCVVSPYKMALRDGVYYLACFDESKNEMAVNQIEYMTNVQMLEASVKDYRMVKGASQWNYDLGYFLDIKLKQK